MDVELFSNGKFVYVDQLLEGHREGEGRASGSCGSGSGGQTVESVWQRSGGVSLSVRTIGALCRSAPPDPPVEPGFCRPPPAPIAQSRVHTQSQAVLVVSKFYSNSSESSVGSEVKIKPSHRQKDGISSVQSSTWASYQNSEI